MSVDSNILKHDPLIALPGLICDSAIFAGIQSRFPGVDSIDGYYAGADRIEDMASHVIARAPARFGLIGHSMGARIALEIAARVPDRVTRLVLANTGVHGVSAGERDKRYTLRDLGRREGFERLVDQWLPPMVGAAGRADATLMADLRDMCLRAGQAVFEAQIEALLHRPDAGRVLPQIACPTLVVVGNEDIWSPVAQHQAISKHIRASQLHVMPGVGHMAPAENPATFNGLIEAWLASTSAPPN